MKANVKMETESVESEIAKASALSPNAASNFWLDWLKNVQMRRDRKLRFCATMLKFVQDENPRCDWKSCYEAVRQSL